MEKENKFSSVFHKLENSRELNDDIDFSESDDENQNIANNNDSLTNLNHSISERPSKRTIAAKRKSRRFKPLQCITISRRSSIGKSKNQSNKINSETFQKEAEIVGSKEFCELFSSQELHIDWDSSGELKENSQEKKLAKAIKPTAIPCSGNGTQTQTKIQCTQSNSKDLFKRCRKGGYLQQLKTLIDKAKTDQKFLKYDKKFGARINQNLEILDIQHSFGVPIATCLLRENQQKYEVILDRELGKCVKIGDELDAFFDESNENYRTVNGKLQIVLQPRKILFKS